MSDPQQGTVYRYLRVDADHDISADPLALTLDNGTTWITTGIVYVAVADLPPAPAAAHAARPPATGFAGYWWRILTGPGTSFPLLRNTGNTIRGRVTDSPESPHVEWKVRVAAYE